MNKISNSSKVFLAIQKYISFISFLFLYCSYWIILFVFMRYRVKQLKLIRKKFKKLSRTANAPLLICANHLTYIDSILLIIICGSYFDYLRNFKTMPWNFPKISNVRKNLFFRTLGFLGKCIFIETDEHHSRSSNDKPMDLAKYLLSKGEYIMLFPEGHRSTTGQIDDKNFGYGVGKIIYELANIRVLCIYLRGDAQKVASKYPHKYDNFYCSLDLLDPKELVTLCCENSLNKHRNSELRKIRELSHKVIEHLRGMEQAYFKLR